ncbi:phosphatidylglycerophosphatase A [Leptolyngbya sp. 15MV]|nr:phosphatidylglycerophosphatase A [Leptolyngbya sp. 15MV]
MLLALGAGPTASPWLWHLVMGAIVVLASAGCIAQAEHARARFVREDPSQVVADETAGQALALMFLPAAAFANPGSAWWTLVLAFVGFRVFDIVKPFPAREAQSIAGAWGILLDDLLAAVYTIVTIHIVVALVR